MTTASSPTAGAGSGSLDVEFGSTYADDLPELVLEWKGAAVADPKLVIANGEVAAEIGLDREQLDSTEGLQLLTGVAEPETAPAVALVYAGHQFGGYSPRLGDGRAMLLGELTDVHGRRRDVHLKGTGRTPFARGGDGKATIGPMLREYVIAEALHALGVPTTRALAVISTGEYVQRNRMEPGAILARVASSHIRVGTFEYAARLEDRTVLRRLADHAIARHHPQAAESKDPPLALLSSTIEVQAALVAEWMLLGFIHGVMNTDNVTISGEGIDYGPCAFMDRFDPATVYSSIDHGGRYAFGNQPAIATWDLARLAETLIPLMGDDPEAAAERATAALHGFETSYGEHWRRGMRAKIGLVDPPSDGELFDDLWSAMHADNLDVTNTFRALARSLRADSDMTMSLMSGSLTSWNGRWRAALDREGRDARTVAEAMDAVNPLYIPRNHLVEEALESATTTHDTTLFETLVDVVTKPFEERHDLDRYTEPADDDFSASYRTFCGT